MHFRYHRHEDRWQEAGRGNASALARCSGQGDSRRHEPDEGGSDLQNEPVRAEVEILSNLSAHADYAEILGWLEHFKAAPRQTFVTHGEPVAADALRHRIEERLHWRCKVPDYKEQVDLA